MSCSMVTRKDPAETGLSLNEWMKDMCDGALWVEPEAFISIWDPRDWANAYTIHAQVKRARREGLGDLLTYVTDDHVPEWLLTRLDGHLVAPQEDRPGPELFSYTGDLDWFALADERPGQVDLRIQYDGTPDLERIRAVADTARKLGADVQFFAEPVTDVASEGIEVHLEAMGVGQRPNSPHSLQMIRQRISDDFGPILESPASPVGFPEGHLSWEWFG